MLDFWSNFLGSEHLRGSLQCYSTLFLLLVKRREFAEQYHIDSIPTLLVFKDGQLQETLSNSSNISLNNLKEFFKTHK